KRAAAIALGAPLGVFFFGCAGTAFFAVLVVLLGQLMSRDHKNSNRRTGYWKRPSDLIGLFNLLPEIGTIGCCSLEDTPHGRQSKAAEEGAQTRQSGFGRV